MTHSDRPIDEALSAEERDLLNRIGDEPGSFQQLFGLFSGRTGWMSALMMIAQTALFLAGAWAAWRFMRADEVLEALRWGLPAAVALLMSLVIKLSAWPVVHITQLRLEVKRLQLQLARR